MQSPREYRGDCSRERSLIGEKIGLSESEGFSGLCFGERVDVAKATESREVVERSWVTARPGYHQAKPDRKVVQREPRDLRCDPVSGVSGEILRSRKLVERSGRKPGRESQQAKLGWKLDTAK